MKITSVHLETELIIDEDRPQILISESPSQFFRFVSELNRQMRGEDGEFVFTSDGTEISPSKTGEMITDLFNFEFNDKKIINLLYKKLEKNYNDGEFIVKFNEINSKVGGFLEDLFFTLPMNLTYEEISPQELFKAFSVSVKENYDSFLEKVVCYINVFAELKACKFFIFVNLKSFLSDEELKMLYSHCRKEKIGLFLLESSKIRELLPDERAILITEDLCEIVANSENK